MGNVVIQALDTLTLGNTSDASASFAVKGFEAKNLNLVMGGDDTAFKVANDIVLVSDKEVGRTAKNKVIEAADIGTITGSDIDVNGGSLTVAAGNYSTAGQNITITDGSLDVTSEIPTLDANDVADTIASSLTINGGKLSIAAKANSNSISVSGKKASLDLSKAASIGLTGTSSADVVPVTVSEGTLVLNGSQVSELVKQVDDGSSGKKAASIALTKHGVLKITDSLEIKGVMLSGGEYLNEACKTSNQF